jgi:putative hydrolases of HD superfamily
VTIAAGTMRDAFRLVRLALMLGRVERGVSHPDGKPETDTDHSVSLAWLACSLAQEWYPWMDRGLIAQFALVHDAVEAYAGDTYAVTALTDASKADQHHREAAAASQITGELPVLSWLPAMIARYEQQAEPEARLVWAVDKIMPKIVLRIEGTPAARLGAHGVTREIAALFRKRETASLQERAGDLAEVLQLHEEIYAMLSAEGGILAGLA